MAYQMEAAFVWEGGMTNRRIAIFSPYATVSPHFETELELAQRHLDQSDSVDCYSCFGALACCDFNSERLEHRCTECVARRRHGYSLLDGNFNQFHLTSHVLPKELVGRVTGVRTIEQLKSIRVEDFDIGYAVLSSLVSKLRDPEPNLAEHRQLVERLFEAAFSVYLSTCKSLEQFHYDRVYVFNGRFASMRAVLRACQKVGVNCCIHERGCSVNHFSIYTNHLPHDIEPMQKLIRDTWKNAGPGPRRDEIAQTWFHNRRYGVEKNWTSFTKDQVPGLPANWDTRRRNIVLFTSSDDEFVAIGDSWKHQLYKSQLDGVTQIAKSLGRMDPSCHLWLRMHPNLANTDHSAKRQMAAIKLPNLTVIAPDSICSSYELLDAATTVATFGSSIGIEAAYWHKPSVLLGPCYYQRMGATYEPQTHNEVVKTLSQNLKPLDNIAAKQYGYYFNSFGTRFQYFEPDGWYHGRFRGEVVYAKS
ncbi:MAG: hypothetical protein R3C03_02195 [Pirellulaceae bacterium]